LKEGDALSPFAFNNDSHYSVRKIKEKRIQIEWDMLASGLS
jgi:hypothetical protein